MDSIFTGALKNLWRLKTGFWYSRISEVISPALNENRLASAAPPAETRKKSRRFMIGDYITMDRAQRHPPLEVEGGTSALQIATCSPRIVSAASGCFAACLFPRPE